MKKILSAIILGLVIPSLMFGLIAFLMWDISFLKESNIKTLFRILFAITFILALFGMSQENK